MARTTDMLQHASIRVILHVTDVNASQTRPMHVKRRYTKSLKRMREVAVERGVSTIYPAHGPVVSNAVGKLDEYIGHRAARTAQVETTLPPAGSAGLTCEQITRLIYTEHPEHLIAPAALNTMLVRSRSRLPPPQHRTLVKRQGWWPFTLVIPLSARARARVCVCVCVCGVCVCVCVCVWCVCVCVC
jgi:hypothetical protein